MQYLVSCSFVRARAPALDRKVPVTQTLSFCQMHFLSPLPVAFDRKLVSVIPVTVRLVCQDRNVMCAPIPTCKQGDGHT